MKRRTSDEVQYQVSLAKNAVKEGMKVKDAIKTFKVTHNQYYGVIEHPERSSKKASKKKVRKYTKTSSSFIAPTMQMQELVSRPGRTMFIITDDENALANIIHLFNKG